MLIDFPDDLKRKIEEFATLSNITIEEVLNLAFKIYLDNVNTISLIEKAKQIPLQESSHLSCIEESIPMTGEVKTGEERFRKLIESVTDYIYTVKIENGRPVSTLHEPGCVNVTGYTSEDYITDSFLWYRMIYEEDRHLVTDQADKLLSGEAALPLEHRIIHKNGSIRWVKNVPVLQYDSQGHLIAYDGLISDITERKRIEESLKASEERFRKLVESVTDYIYTVKIENGRPVSTFHGIGCVTVTGYTSEEYADNPNLWYQMIYEEDRRLVTEQAAKLLRGEALALEHRIIHKNNSIRWVRNTPVLRFDGQARLIAYDGLIADITERKKTESENSRLQNLESLGILAGGIAHDFRNILTVIKGQCSIAQIKCKDDSLKKNISSIIKATNIAVGLTHQLFTFAEGGTANKEITVIRKLIEDSLKILAADSNIKMVFQFEETRPFRGDRTQMIQALQNIILNAKEAMPDGGSVIISTLNVLDEDKPFTKITIKDTGRGIPKENIHKIFNPYFSTKIRSKEKGSGLGLSVCHAIIKRHGGKILVDSQIGVGTTFEIYLPAVEKKGI